MGGDTNGVLTPAQSGLGLDQRVPWFLAAERLLDLGAAVIKLLPANGRKLVARPSSSDWSVVGVRANRGGRCRVTALD